MFADKCKTWYMIPHAYVYIDAGACAETVLLTLLLVTAAL